MHRKPFWAWRQRGAVTRFLIAFYLRRVLRFICIPLSLFARGRQSSVSAVALPTRRRPQAAKS